MPVFDNKKNSKAAVQGAVISIDPLSETVKFCTSDENGDTLKVTSSNYRVRPYDKEFYDRLVKIINQQNEKNPDMNIERSTLILPDQLFLLDTVTIPMIHRKAMQHSLSLAIEAIYNNASEMNLMTYGVSQTKQAATFGIVGIRNDLLDNVHKAFDDNGVDVTSVTFASNATVNGAVALNPKLKGDTFLLIDIKEDYTRYAFVVRGVTMGYYDLPFGHSILYKTKVVQEDMLFDHRAGDLLVLNAKERARAKQLTMEGVKTEGEDGEVVIDSYEKTARKLPKSMQRPTPQSKEEYIYDNFRVFIKWALELLRNNREITSITKLSSVYINMPSEYKFLYSIINNKHERTGYTFYPLLNQDADTSVMENLDLYGGFYTGKPGEANTF